MEGTGQLQNGLVAATSIPKIGGGVCVLTLPLSSSGVLMTLPSV